MQKDVLPLTQTKSIIISQHKFEHWTHPEDSLPQRECLWSQLGNCQKELRNYALTATQLFKYRSNLESFLSKKGHCLIPDREGVVVFITGGRKEKPEG